MPPASPGSLLLEQETIGQSETVLWSTSSASEAVADLGCPQQAAAMVNTREIPPEAILLGVYLELQNGWFSTRRSVDVPLLLTRRLLP